MFNLGNLTTKLYSKFEAFASSNQKLHKLSKIPELLGGKTLIDIRSLQEFQYLK